MPDLCRPNRGRAAGDRNRQALVAAARRVFAAGGLAAPLSAVARAAGVGQGSLYRHFPDRIDLAVAAFEHNVTELEELAADPRTTLDDLLALVTRHAVESVAFVDMVTSTTDDARLVDLARRVITALSFKLPAAQERGEFRSDLTAEDVFLAVSMVANLVSRTPAEEREAAAVRAWALLRRGLEPNP